MKAAFAPGVPSPAPGPPRGSEGPEGGTGPAPAPARRQPRVGSGVSSFPHRPSVFVVAPPDVRAKARFFASQEALRRWFEEHHATAKEIWIAYPKKGTRGRGISYLEAVEEALCFGWVDGRLRSLDERSYANRYTPRRPGRRWSETNVARFRELQRSGRVHRAGAAAFRRRAASGSDEP